MNRKQLSTVTELSTRHTNLKKHLNKIVLYNEAVYCRQSRPFMLSVHARNWMTRGNNSVNSRLEPKEFYTIPTQVGAEYKTVGIGIVKNRSKVQNALMLQYERSDGSWRKKMLTIT